MSVHDRETRERYPFIDLLHREAAMIRAEVDAIEPSAFVPMPNYPSGWTAFLLDAGRWESEFPRVDFDANRRRCPHTYRTIAGIEGLMLGGFLRLEPGGSIGPHEDFRDDDMVRCHLGLHLPVAEQGYWPELAARLMDVRQTHSARNDGDQARVTLVIDVRMRFVVPTGSFGSWQPPTT